jgi:TctA family transporter
MGFILKEDKENLLTEYHVLREEIMDRDYKTWVITAILIIGSLLAAFNPQIQGFNAAIISVLLVLTALVLYSTSEKINNINRSRIKEVTKQLHLYGPAKIREGKIAKQWWYAARRNVAYILFTILIGIYLFLIFVNIYVLITAILIGLIFVVVREAISSSNQPSNNLDGDHLC